VKVPVAPQMMFDACAIGRVNKVASARLVVIFHFERPRVFIVRSAVGYGFVVFANVITG
jgi:hypothetical protein